MRPGGSRIDWIHLITNASLCIGGDQQGHHAEPLTQTVIADAPDGASPADSRSAIRLNQAREYLVDQLVIVATWLTESHIFRKDPELPLCQLCLMSGLNGRPIPHLSSCPVGRVLSATEQLKDAPPSKQWKGWDVERVSRVATERA